MITYNNLWNDFISFENLHSSALKAQKGKRWKNSTLRFNFNLESNLIRVQNNLVKGNWKPGKYWSFTIFEPKKRIIHAAPYVDRIVHHAVINILEPIWEKRFYTHSYACRKGKGTHSAVDTCQKYMNRYNYVLKCDIRKYFPSIDREILKKIIHKKITDIRLVKIINNIIDSSPEFEDVENKFNSANDDQLCLFYNSPNYKKGIPIGNLTSQFFANVYLNELDSWIKHELGIKGYVRYMDDFLVFHNYKQQLNTIKMQTKSFLSNNLLLDLHPKKAEVFPVKNGIPFLGYHVFKTHRRLQKNNIKRFLTRMKRKQDEYSKNKITFVNIMRSIKAWIGHCSHADTWNLRDGIFLKLVFSKSS